MPRVEWSPLSRGCRRVERGRAVSALVDRSRRPGDERNGRSAHVGSRPHNPSVEAGHELPVRQPGGGQLLRALVELDADVRDLGFEESDAEVEAVDVVGRAEPGLALSPPAQHRRESTFELLDPGHQAAGAVLGRQEVGPQRSPAHGEGPVVAADLGVASPGIS